MDRIVAPAALSRFKGSNRDSAWQMKFYQCGEGAEETVGVSLEEMSEGSNRRQCEGRGMRETYVVECHTAAIS